MAHSIKEKDTVSLNSFLYTIKGKIHAQYVPRTVGKINTGSDSLDKEQFLSNYIIKDQRGGLGIEEMDESVHSNRNWWSNCLVDFDGHITLPRLATALTNPTLTAPSLTNGDAETGDATGWTFEGGYAASSTSPLVGSYSFRNSLKAARKGYQDIVWDTSYRKRCVVISCVYKCNSAADADLGYVSINDGVGTTTTHGAETLTLQTLTCTRLIDVAATQLRITIGNTKPGGIGRVFQFDSIVLTASALGSSTHAANFNSNLYWASGDCLLKLDTSAGASLTLVRGFPTNITALIPSLNNCLYIYLGDSDYYCYMDTSGVITQTNVANNYWGIQCDGRLYGISTSGTMQYATTPNSATPTWTSVAGITDIPEQIESFFIGTDASGNPVIYCATNSKLKVYNATSDKWLDTWLSLPNHPNGGKGACYWHDGHFISYGLGVKKYVTGTTATISEVGLDLDGGLPAEYNGEIVKLLGDSAQNVMFALVDASQVTGTQKSGLYASTGSSWRCWWADSSNNGSMHDVIVSSAYTSDYRVYFDCGDSVYYISIPRGTPNPKLLSTQTYALSGIHITPWFDAGSSVYKKLAKRFRTWAKGITTTETVAIKYRIDRAYVDLDSGWTTLETLDTTAENGENEELFASGAGLGYSAIQFRFDLARGGTNTLTPDFQAALAYELSTKGTWIWTFTIEIDGLHGPEKKAQSENLETCLTSDTLVPLIFRTSGTHYIRARLISGWSETGQFFDGEQTMQCIEV